MIKALEGYGNLTNQNNCRSYMQSSRLGKSWCFDLTFSPALHQLPSLILRQPLVFELYGAGFTRPRGSPYYSLRFPRVSALHHSRLPSECITLQGLQHQARDATSWIESEAEAEIEDLWSRCSGGSETEGNEGSIVEKRSKLGGSGGGWRKKQVCPKTGYDLFPILAYKRD